MNDEPKHTYPSRHPRGSGWATDAGWDILDMINPGVIPEDVRAYLCGLIAGALERIAEEGPPK